jgi:two-component system LytT family sensor kinase
VRPSRLYFAVAFSWPAIGLILSLLHIALDALVTGRFAGRKMLWCVIGFSEWTLLSPAIVFLALRVTYRSHGLLWFAAVHASAAAGAAMLHIALLSRLQGSDAPLMHRFLQNLPLNLLVYGVTLLATQVWLYLREQLRAENELLLLERRVAQTSLDALKLRLQPAFVEEKLAAVASLVEHDLAAAELLIERFSRFLRRSLAAADPRRAMADEIEYVGVTVPPTLVQS